MLTRPIQNIRGARRNLVEIVSATVQWLLKVLVENHEVVVLLHVFLQAVVFCEEVTEFLRRAIVRQHVWLDVQLFEHGFEEMTAVALTLHRLVHVEVQDAHWRDFRHLAADTILHEELLLAPLDEAEASFAVGLHQDLVVHGEELAG